MPANMGFPSPPPVKKPSVYDRLMGGLMGPQQSYGGLLSEADQKAAQQQGLLALGAQLMAAGGPSDQRVSFGQALGPALMAGQQAQRGYGTDMLQAMLLKTKLQKANQKAAPKTHVVGNTLVDDAGNVIYKSEALDNIYGRVNPGDFTPESLAKFEKSRDWSDLRRVWAPPSPTVVNYGGVPNLVQGDRNTGGVASTTALSTLPNEISAATQKAAAEAEAKATGQVTGEAKGGKQKRAISADQVNSVLDIADPLIEVATGSATGAAVDKVAAYFGGAPEGSEAAAQLKILQTTLMLAQPRMEGPQSNFDAQLYKDAAGQIGDPTVPRQIKKAAVKTIRDLQQKYKDAATKPAAGKDRSREEILKQYGIAPRP